MKLLYCPACTDVVRIVYKTWRNCACGKIGAQYNSCRLTATIYGKDARVFGIANPFFNKDFQTWSPQKKGAVHRKFGYKKTEIWWGGDKGDWQLLKTKRRQRLSDKAVDKQVREICEADNATPERIEEILQYLKDLRKKAKKGK